ncbi:MAG: galactose mutarotase [Clostridia bacterium]|nr:galactose mutarotase [Clostridia bacterium]
MDNQRTAYGVMPDGTPVEKVSLTGKNGLSLSFITYGGIITELVYQGKDVVLGHTCLEDYLRGKGSIGVTVGRYANRIAGGKFELNGTVYDVGCNEAGRGHLHGGTLGFEKRVWTLGDLCENSATLHYTAADGEMGYPGTLNVAVTFTLEDDNTLAIFYRATTDKDTVLNLTNHAYFNLNGYDGGSTLDTELQINAESILPVDDLLIPTGERMPVEGTPFDFRVAKPIGRDINGDHAQLKIGGGYDHNFCLGETCEYRHAVSAYSPRSGIRMDCYTDEPGVQLYTGNFLELPFGKGGAMTQYQGFCLETQHFPDSPNHPDFPSTVLKAGDTFESTTRYHFS